MSRTTVRLAALAGAAAVALGVASPTVAAATERTATVHSTYSYGPSSAVVDGRTISVQMPASHYQATADHTTAVTVVAAAAPQPVGNYTPRGTTGTVTPAYTTNVNLSGGGAISAGIVGTLVVAVIIYFGVKHHKVSIAWGIAFVILGIGLAQTGIGSALDGLKTTAVTAAASILNSF